MGRFKRGFRCGWLLVLGLLGGLTAHAEAPVWALKGARNTVYLAGSVHVLRAGDAKLPAAFDKAYADSRVIVMEVDLDDLDQGELQGWVLQNGMYLTPDASLQQAIGKERFEKLQAQASKLGLPDMVIDRMEPWLAAMTLTQMQLMNLGFDPSQGVEMQMLTRAKADNKTIDGFETMSEQMGFLDGLAPADQIRFLDMTLEEMKDTEKSVSDLVNAWRTGDAKKLADIMSEEFEVAPALYKTLVVDRNARWMPELEKLLKSDQNYLVVVGALHLVGKGGLLELAKAKGVQAKQLQ